MPCNAIGSRRCCESSPPRLAGDRSKAGRRPASTDFAVRTPAGPLAALQPAIDRCFAGDSVEAILDALAAEAAGGGAHAAWAAETRASLLTKSPTSLKITLRQLTIGRDYDLEAALALEYRLTQHVMAAHDFYEGVRAMLIDKDQKPRWRPATLGRGQRQHGRCVFRADRRPRTAVRRQHG